MTPFKLKKGVEKKKVPTSINLDRDMYDELTIICKKNNLALSHLIIQMVEHCLTTASIRESK